MNQQTLDFIAQHAADDVRTLALQAHKNTEVDLPFALEQIRGRQLAARKLPLWAATEGIVYPPHLALEQCSSQQTAQYKADLLARLCAEVTEQSTAGTPQEPRTLVDLTGGFGVDFSWMAPQLQRAVYVERQALLCERAAANFPLLGLHHAEIVCQDAEAYLSRMERAAVIYLDPARRDANGGKTVAIEQCSPDIALLKTTLCAKARFVIVKLSPMLSHQLAVQTLNNGGAIVKELHIISVQNECKELLMVLQEGFAGEPKVFCVNDEDVFSYAESQVAGMPLWVDEETEADPSKLEGCYLYEPNASLMKAGCHALLSRTYGVKAVGQNSHLFISKQRIDHWQGRSFCIRTVSSLNKKEMKHRLAGLERANIAVRNFPLTVQQLRQRLNLKEGGSYLFGTTVGKRTHLLLVCEKLP